MIIHIVLGKPRDDLSGDERQELDEALSALDGVPGVMAMTWGRDISGRGKGYTTAAVMQFESRETLDQYQIHPEHQRVVQVLNRLMPDRLIVDYVTDTSGISS